MAHELGSVLPGAALGPDRATDAARLLIERFYSQNESDPIRPFLAEHFANHPGLLASVDEAGAVTGAAIMNTDETQPPERMRRPDEDEAQISLITVVHRSRRRDIGTLGLLLSGVEAAAEEAGKRVVTVVVPHRDSEKERLRTFYIRRGYDTDPVVRTHDGYIRRLPSR